MVGTAERVADREAIASLTGGDAGYEDVVVKGFRWRVLRPWRPWLLGPEGLKIDEWLAAGQARIIKRGTHRTVYRVELQPGTFYVKHNHVPDWTTWLRQLIRPSKARWEFYRAVKVAARGVPTAFPLAFGAERAWLDVGESFLITSSLDDTEPLNDFLIHRLRALPPDHQARLRAIIAQRLGTWVAKLQNAGLWHGDFHAGNILVRWDGADDVDFFLIDLSTVRLYRPLGVQDSLAQLAVFSHWFLLRCQRSDRLRFWLAYCLARGQPFQQRLGLDLCACRNHATALENQCWLSNQRFWLDRDRRCRETNRYYRQVRGRGIIGHVVRDLDEAALQQLLADPDEPFRRANIKLLKNSKSSTVAEMTLMVNGQLRPVIYKRFRVTSWKDPLASLLRTSPAVRSWIHGHGFRERGLPTARPLAVLERHRWGLRQEGYLLAEKIEDAQELHQYVHGLQELPEPERRQRLRRLSADIARLIRAVHDRQYAHRDLKAANLLVVHEREGKPEVPADFSTLGGFLHLLQPSLVLIDLVGVTCHPKLRTSRKRQNLARLNASFLRHPLSSRTEKLRFLFTYLGANLHRSSSWKTWWRAIDQATQAKIRRNQKSGRVLA